MPGCIRSTCRPTCPCYYRTLDDHSVTRVGAAASRMAEDMNESERLLCRCGGSAETLTGYQGLTCDAVDTWAGGQQESARVRENRSWPR